MLTNEALEVLALRPGASAVEIKGAYRDLVKVWHPDRFGSDPRLREKAEDKLKQINEAYLVLQSDRTGGMNEADGASVSMRGDAARRWDSSSVPRTHRRGRNRSTGISGNMGRLYLCVAIALGLTAGYVAIEHGTTLSAGPASVSRQPVDASAPAIPAVQTAGEGAAAGGDVESGELPVQSVSTKDSSGSKAAGSPPFQVRVLSNAEMALLGSACSQLEGLKNSTAYETCVRAQLDLIANARGKPDLSSLSVAERESIESVCSEAKRLHGTDRYHLCLVDQMAQLAAEPARPDVSGLSEADRSSIERACSKAKYREGPAAYERCRGGFVELLAKSR